MLESDKKSELCMNDVKLILVLWLHGKQFRDPSVLGTF